MFGNVIKSPYLFLFVLLSIFTRAETISYDFDEIGIVESSMDSVGSNVPALRQRILEQDERIDGLTTIIEGLSSSLNELRSENRDSTISSNDKSSNNNDVILQKLANMIDEINSKYISRKEVEKMLKGQNAITPKASVETTDTPKISKSNATMYSEGVRHFFKKRYTEAKKQFETTAKKGYKPAASNYYLGEIAYYTKNPKDAIFHFKKSAGLYGDASYMDTLLLHTAISLAKTGEIGQAKAFFENIIATYPGKKTADIAANRLQKL
jgi:TolA-binding protein